MHASSGRARPHVAAHLDAGAIGEADVEHGHVRIRGGDAISSLLGGARLADHLEVVLCFEEIAHAAPDDLVVVEQEHTYGHRASLPS